MRRFAARYAVRLSFDFALHHLHLLRRLFPLAPLPSSPCRGMILAARQYNLARPRSLQREWRQELRAGVAAGVTCSEYRERFFSSIWSFWR